MLSVVLRGLCVLHLSLESQVRCWLDSAGEPLGQGPSRTETEGLVVPGQTCGHCHTTDDRRLACLLPVRAQTSLSWKLLLIPPLRAP